VWIRGLNLVNDDAFAVNFGIELVHFLSCFDHQKWDLRADTHSSNSPGRGRLNQTDRVQFVVFGVDSLRYDGGHIQPANSRFGESRGMSAAGARHFVEDPMLPPKG
jgi:hypothetical protein